MLHDSIAGDFHNKATIGASALLCYIDKTWMETVLTSFTKIIAEQPFLTQYERSMYHMREKLICYHVLKSVLLYLFFSIF